jgi:hypothetical protein
MTLLFCKVDDSSLGPASNVFFDSFKHCGGLFARNCGLFIPQNRFFCDFVHNFSLMNVVFCFFCLLFFSQCYLLSTVNNTPYSAKSQVRN